MITNPHPSRNWLGLPCQSHHPECRMAVPKGPASAALGSFLNPRGDGVAREYTDVRLSYDADALHLRAYCHTAALDRIHALAARSTPYARDAWGDDALEIQIDVQRTRQWHRHFILPPNGIPITFVGSNNRQVQGWHPSFSYQVKVEEYGWLIEASFPFSILERTPVDGEIWGFNVLRVNASETYQYVQWAPTFGEALRTELFGEIQFSGRTSDRPAELADYARWAEERKAFFLTTINGVREKDALRELGLADWASWGRYLAQRPAPVALRWEDVTPGRDGIQESDRTWLLETAATQVERIAAWSMDPPDPAAFGIEPLEALGDAYLLTGEKRYVEAFERAIAVHARRMERIMAGVSDPQHLHYATNPYHDSQIIRAEMMAYVYLTMRTAGLSPDTHAAMMGMILRSCRFAAFNISSEYTYGNHQVYESGGLAAVAALFPEFPESDAWAKVSSRAIRLHLEREVYPDGGYMERCGYHSVAMSYVMHAIATIRVNGVEHRFPDLMAASTLGILERMHEWLLTMTAPNGTMPAFGDCGASTQLRFFRRGAAVFARPDFAWPLHQLAPALVPPGLEPRKPNPKGSVTLASDFTILRDGWTPTSFYMAIDHGPLGGQHGHIDTLGFVAYAHGRPVALDSGMSSSYEDPRYVVWFRALRAHNVIAIDAIESEKIAERTFWKPGPLIDVVGFRSRAYAHALGVDHERTIYFVKGLGWLIHDLLAAPVSLDWTQHDIDWILHTPYALSVENPSVLNGIDDGGGLLVLAGLAETLESPRLELKPASVPVAEALEMRLWDVGRRIRPEVLTPMITSLTWRLKPVSGGPCQFATFLLPYRGARPEARLIQTPVGFTLQRKHAPDIAFQCPHD